MSGLECLRCTCLSSAPDGLLSVCCVGGGDCDSSDSSPLSELDDDVSTGDLCTDE